LTAEKPAKSALANVTINAKQQELREFKKEQSITISAIKDEKPSTQEP